MYFFDQKDLHKLELAKGVNLSILSGEKAMMSIVNLEPHSEVPLHDHPHEQMGIILEGEFDFIIGEEKKLCKKGDVYHIPGGVAHAGKTFDKPTLIVDIFSPPREDYQPKGE